LYKLVTGVKGKIEFV